MTAKEYFDLLCHTSREGNFPAVVAVVAGQGKCCYRTPHGLACAVGLLIPDDVYEANSLDLEGRGIPRLRLDYPKIVDNCILPYVPVGMTIKELTRVQGIHDYLGIMHSEWSHANFVERLNAVPCFAGFTDPTEQPTQ